MERTWLSTANVAQRLAVKPRTVLRFIDKGELITYRWAA